MDIVPIRAHPISFSFKGTVAPDEIGSFSQQIAYNAELVWQYSWENLNWTKKKKTKVSCKISPDIRDPYSNQGLSDHTNFRTIQSRATVTLMYRSYAETLLVTGQSK